MATLQENATAVKAAQEAIDAAIRAKGATTAGGLNNAAAAIAAIPSGGGAWTKKSWLDDGWCHFWFRMDGIYRKIAFFNGQFISSNPFTVNWGDGQVDTVAASAKYTNRYLSHEYSEVGDYRVDISGYDNLRLSGSNGVFGSWMAADTTSFYSDSCYNIRQIEFGSHGFYYLMQMNSGAYGAEYIRLPIVNGVGVVTEIVSGSNNYNFCGITKLKEIEGLEDTTKISIQLLVASTAISTLNLGNITSGSCMVVECVSLKNINFKSLAWNNDNWYGKFKDIGEQLDVDADGYKAIVNIGTSPLINVVNPIGYSSSGMFPWIAGTKTKFVGVDGYCRYETNRWACHYATYSDFPTSTEARKADVFYWDDSQNKRYRWTAGSGYYEA